MEVDKEIEEAFNKKVAEPLLEILSTNHEKIKEMSAEIMAIGEKYNAHQVAYMTALLQCFWCIAIPSDMPKELMPILSKLAEERVKEAWTSNKDEILQQAAMFASISTKVPN